MVDLFFILFAVIFSLIAFLYFTNRRKVIEDNRIIPPDKPAPVIREPLQGVPLSELYDKILEQTNLSEEEMRTFTQEFQVRSQMQREMDERWGDSRNAPVSNEGGEDIPEYKKRRNELSKRKSLLEKREKREKSSAERLRDKINDPNSLKDALILSEILSKPPHQDKEDEA
jgi:hypothetical protein